MTRNRRTALALAAAGLPLALVGLGGTVADAQSANPASPRGGSVAHATTATNVHCLSTRAGVKHLYVSISQQYLWACTVPVLLLGTSVHRTKGSHGCVHVPLSALKTIWSWAPVGTLVTIRS